MKRCLRILILFIILLLLDSQCRITVSRYKISVPSLPADFTEMKIIQLSDIHGREFGTGNKRLLQAVEKETPDIITITGDLAEDEKDIPAMMNLLENLSALAPTYYITGNHEWSFRDVAKLKDSIRSTGITVLDNRWEILWDGPSPVLIVGVDDPNGPADMIRPDALIRDVRAHHPDSFILLLGHRNDWVGKYPLLDVDLILCGHGHGGLIRLPGLGGLFGSSRNLLPKYTEGIIHTDRYSMIVSRGLGNSAGTFRLFNNPEIISVSLKNL